MSIFTPELSVQFDAIKYSLQKEEGLLRGIWYVH